MKKLLAILMVFIMVLSSMPALANYTMEEDYVFHNLLPEDSMANYNQYYEDQNVTRYAPWIKQWHMETAEKYERAKTDKSAYGGEAGQVVMSLAVSPVNPDNVLAGTDIAGGWVSNSGGKHWTVIDGVFTTGAPDVIWDPIDEKVAYMIQGERNGYGKQPKTNLDGLYKTEDAGHTWEQISARTFVTTANYSENLMDFDKAGNLYYLSSEGIVKRDRETGIETVLGMLVTTAAVSKNDSSSTSYDDTEYADDPSEYSFKTGIENVTTEKHDYKKSVYSMYVSDDGNAVAVAIYSGLYKGTNTEGNWSWTKITPGNNVPDGYDCYSIAVDPTNSDHWVATYEPDRRVNYTDSQLEILRKQDNVYWGFVLDSINAGKTWNAVYDNSNNNDTRFPAFVKFGPAKDGRNGGKTARLYMVYTSMDTPVRYLEDGTDLSSLYKSDTDNSSNKSLWMTPSIGGEVNNERFLYDSNGYTSEGLAICEHSDYLDTVYYSFGDIIYKSTNSGTSFTLSSAGYSAVLVRQIYFDKNNKMWLPMQDKGLAVANEAYTTGMYNENKLPTVKLMNPNSTTGGNNGGHKTSVSVVSDPNDSDHVFASFGGWEEQTLYKSENGGASWTPVSGVDKVNWSMLKYVDNTTIISNEYISKDDGATWTKHYDNSFGDYNVYKCPEGDFTYYLAGGYNGYKHGETKDNNTGELNIDGSTAWATAKETLKTCPKCGTSASDFTGSLEPIQITSVSNKDSKIWYSKTGCRKSYIRRTTDGGETWGPQYSVTNGTEIQIAYPDETTPDVCWVGGANGGIWKITYDGNTGSEKKACYDTGEKDENGKTIYKYPYMGTGYAVKMNKIKQNPNDANHLVAGGEGDNAGSRTYGLIETYDGGETWHVVKGFKGVMTIDALEFSPITDEIFIGSGSNGTLIYDYGMYRKAIEDKHKITFDVSEVNEAEELSLTAPYTYTGKFLDEDTGTYEAPIVEGLDVGTYYWKKTYTVKSLYGDSETETVRYQPGDTISVDYTDVTLNLVYNTAENTTFKNGDTEINSLEAGTITATRTITGAAGGTAVPILGLYDRANPFKLIKLVIGNQFNLTDGENDITSAGITLTEEEISGAVLKLFIWDSLTNALPIVNVESIR